MIVSAHQDVLISWLCKRIGLVPSPSIRCIGNVVDGKLAGVVGFDAFNGASVLMHIAGEGNWLSRSMLFAAFDYAFRVLNCKVVLGLVPSGNLDALRFNEHIGFKMVVSLKDAHPDGALFLMTMSRDQCRWTNQRFAKELKHGQEERTTPAA